MNSINNFFLTVLIILFNISIVHADGDKASVNGHDSTFLRNQFLKKRQQEGSLSGNLLYKQFVQEYLLSEHYKKKNDILLNESSTTKEQEDSSDDVERHVRAYANYPVSCADVQSDSKTYHEVGIKNFIDAVDPRLIVGKASLAGSLCTPTTNSATIENEQEKQKVLEENNDDELYNIINNARKGEKALLDFGNARKINHYKLVMKKYLPHSSSWIPPLKESATANEISWFLCTNIIGVVTSFYAFMLSKSFGCKTPLLKVFRGIAIGLAWSYSGYAVYHQRTNEDDIYAHQLLIDVADYVRSAAALSRKIKQNSGLHKHFSQFCETYDELCNHQATKSIVADLTKTNTFTGSPAIFSRVGRIALVLNRLSAPEAYEKFISMMNEMGKMDKYFSLVRYKKNNAGVIPFTYSEMKEELGSVKKSFIKAESFIAPSSFAPKDISNSIIVGDHDLKKIVIRGGNGCGKSFISKALLANVITAQSLGFAHAQSFQLSPFYEISYSANIGDITGKKSRYQLEAMDLGKVYEKNSIAGLLDMPGLYVLDEPCSATNAHEGERVLNSFVTDWINKILADNGLFFIITHHDVNVSDDQVKYYHIDSDDKFILRPGKFYKSNAKEIADEELQAAEERVAAFIAELESYTTNSSAEGELVN